MPFLLNWQFSFMKGEPTLHHSPRVSKVCIGMSNCRFLLRPEKWSGVPKQRSNYCAIFMLIQWWNHMLDPWEYCKASALPCLHDVHASVNIFLSRVQLPYRPKTFSVNEYPFHSLVKFINHSFIKEHAVPINFQDIISMQESRWTQYCLPLNSSHVHAS